MQKKSDRTKYTTYLSRENREYLTLEAARRKAAGERGVTEADILNEAVDEKRKAPPS